MHLTPLILFSLDLLLIYTLWLHVSTCPLSLVCYIYIYIYFTSYIYIFSFESLNVQYQFRFQSLRSFWSAPPSGGLEPKSEVLKTESENIQEDAIIVSFLTQFSLGR